MIFRKWGGGSKAVWNFSENSPDLAQPSFPQFLLLLNKSGCLLSYHERTEGKWVKNTPWWAMREMGVIGAVVATSKLPNLGSDESVTWNFLNSSLYCLRQLQRGVLQSICKLEIWASWTPNKLNVKQTRNTFATRQSKQCEFSSWYIFWSVRVMGHLIRVIMVAQAGRVFNVVQVVR